MRNKIKKITTRFIVCYLLAMTSLPLSAAVTFTFNYTDPAGVGFNAAAPLGDARKAALVQTGELLSNIIPAYTTNIVMSVNGAETMDSTLAAAGANYSSANAGMCAVGYNKGDVESKILDNVDPDTSKADGTITVNFEDFMWDLDDNIEATKFDFKSTMLHELFHAVGFTNAITQDAKDGCGTSAPSAGGWFPYDQFLGNQTANFINSSFVINTAAWSAAVTGGTGNAGLLWRGSNAVSANSGNPVPLFSPSTFSSGSSVAHLDDDFYNNINLLMESATGPGQGIRTLSAIEQGMLKDLGYTLTTTPTPGGKKNIVPIYLLLLE